MYIKLYIGKYNIKNFSFFVAIIIQIYNMHKIKLQTLEMFRALRGLTKCAIQKLSDTYWYIHQHNIIANIVHYVELHNIILNFSMADR